MIRGLVMMDSARLSPDADKQPCSTNSQMGMCVLIVYVVNDLTPIICVHAGDIEEQNNY